MLQSCVETKIRLEFKYLAESTLDANKLNSMTLKAPEV